MRKGSIAAVTGWLICLAIAQPASASRPFDWAVLHKGTDPNRLRLVVRTTTGIEKPRRLQLRFHGEGIAARELKGSVGRWAVGEKTARERSFAVAIAEHMDLFGQARIHAIGRYGGPCDGTFRVLFKLEELNVRDDEAQFRKATSCERRRAQTERGALGLFGPAYRSTAVTKDGEPRELVDGTRLRAKFTHDDDGDALAWRAGCNYFGSRIEVTNNQIDVRRGSNTEIAAERP
ncbi:MAG: hypothetical protein WKF62_03095 [Solirubrobacterales bacterium]